MHVSIEALLARGVEVEVVAPARPGSRSWVVAGLRAVREGLPLPVARHRSPATEQEVRRSITRQRPDAVHVEQVQALPQAAPARALGVPVVLRAQNVESDLWRQAARGRVSARLGRLLARRFEAWEGRVIGDVDLALAVTEADRRSLERLAGGRGRIDRATVPFPVELPPGEARPGSPAVSLFVGRGWEPSRRGGAWFVREVWPEVRRRAPEAHLHLFGEDVGASLPPGVTTYPPPEESRTAFPAGAILVVPLAVASGIRMKVLEAWSRGIPVVGTSRALDGLEGEDGSEWLRADEPGEMAGAIATLSRDGALRERLVESGRRRLRRTHAPERFAADYLDSLASLGVSAGGG